MSVILFTIAIFILAENCTFIDPFVARKLTHLFCGIVLLSSDGGESSTRTFILVIASGVPIMNWCMRPLRFTKPKDSGILLFGIVVFAWAYYSLPFIFLAPLLIADPLAAIAGRYFSTTVWHKDKTLLGSTVFFTVTAFLMSYYEASIPMILLVSYAATITEALGGSWDNFLIALPLYAHYLMSD